MSDFDWPAEHGAVRPARLEWFRLWTEARTDNKLRILADDEHRVWFHLLCYAAEQRGAARGTFDAADLDFLAVEVARADRGLLERTLAQLQRLRIVAISPEGQGVFVHWAARQYDKPSALPERVRQRVAAHRERERNATAPAGNPLYKGGNAEQRPVTPSNAEQRPVTACNEERRGEERRGEESLLPAAEVLWEGVQGEPNGVVAPATPAATTTPLGQSMSGSLASAPPPAATGTSLGATTSPPTAARLPVSAANKLGEFTDLIRAAGLPYEPTAADGRALKTSRLAASQVAACYLALACGEFGDDWQRDHLCAATAIGAHNAWQTARQVPVAARAHAPPRDGRVTVADVAAARLRAIQAARAAAEQTETGGEDDGRVRVFFAGDGPVDGQLSAPRRLT